MGKVSIDGGDIAFVRVLGPIQVVTTAGRVLDLPSASQRRLLARLAVDAPRALRVDLLCDVLAVSPGALRTIVSRLRKGFGGTTVVASQGRYRLAAPVDAALFTASLSRLGAGDDRIGTLERALALWTGPAFEEFSAEAWAGPEAARLAELHASAIEDHAVALIVARRWAEAIAELKAHVSVNPLRDRAWGLLIQALGGAGRQADALAAFREYHAYLAEWVGTEPSAEVHDIQRRIAAGWDGTEAAAGRDGAGRQGRPVRSGPPQPARPSSWRGNGWLPLQAELAWGPAVVGRARELELLAAEAAQVGGSGLRAVIVEGEAGIGKTTLLGAFARAVRDKGSAVVLYGRCQDGPAVPLEPFRALAGHLVEHAPVDVLRAHVTRCGGHLVRMAPRLARSLDRLHAIADQIGAPHMTWTVGWYEAFVATMQARFADAGRLGRETVELGLAMGAADGVALFAGQAAVLATIAGHHAELPPLVAEAIGAGPVQLTFYLAHAIVSVASGPTEVASDLLGEAAAAGFRNVPPDLMWMTSMLGYAILAIELEDPGAAAELLAIIEPYTGEIATNLGPVAAYAGRLASLLGRHDVADQHLNAALEIADTFDWDYHRAAILIARAAARRRSLGRLDDPARAWLATAEGICAAHGLPGMLAMIGGLRA